MTKPTDYLAKAFSRDIQEAGMHLLHKGAVLSVTYRDSGLITSLVKDGKDYEVEIKSPYTAKLKAQCNCSNFSRMGTCRHIAATLFFLRESRIDAESGKYPSAGIKNIPKSGSLHIGQILENIDFEELKTFVKLYARNDRKFDLQLKAHFASKLDWDDNTEKYRKILNVIIPPSKESKPRKLSQADIKTITTILETFAGQINDAIALGQYRSALNQFEPSFSKILYLNTQYAQKGDTFQPMLKAFHSIVTSFFSEKLPPELRTELVSLMIDFAGRSYYVHNHVFLNIFTCMESHLLGMERKKAEAAIIELIVSRPVDQKAVLAAILILYRKEFTNSSFQILSEHHIPFVEVADKLTVLNEQPLVAGMLLFLKNKGIATLELRHRALIAYATLKDFDGLKKEAELLYAETGDVKYLSLMKEVLPSDSYSKWCTDLEFSLLKGQKNQNALINLYRFEKNWAGLLLYLERLNDVEQLMQYDTCLYREEKAALTDLWLATVRQYMSVMASGTIGAGAVEAKMLDVSKHFRLQKMELIRKKTHHMLSTEYPSYREIIAFFS